MKKGYLESIFLPKKNIFSIFMVESVSIKNLLLCFEIVSRVPKVRNEQLKRYFMVFDQIVSGRENRSVFNKSIKYSQFESSQLWNRTRFRSN